MDIEQALSDTRTSQATIGLTKKTFEKLEPLFDNALKRNLQKKTNGAGRPFLLRTTREKLFFVLYYLKNYPTYDVLGVEFGMHRSNAYRNVNRYMEALNNALQKCHCIPSDSIGKMKNKLKNVEVIIIDGTEQRKNRPKDQEKQRDYYSGKKNATR